MAIDKLEETKKEILLYLGVNRMGHYYGIYKYLTLKKGTRPYLIKVWRALQRLKLEYLIESFEHKKQLEKGQKKGPYYRLTIIGLLKIFTYDDLYKHLSSIVENHANKALIFSEWDYFEEQGVKGKIIEAIKGFYTSYVSENSHFPGLEKQHPTLKRELDRYVLFYHLPIVSLAPFFRIKDRSSSLMAFERFRLRSFPWIRIWYDRRKLRRFMTREITQEQIMARDALIHIMEAKNFIRSLAHPIQSSSLHHNTHSLSKRTKKLDDWTLE
jgi:hypothetical protein